MPRINLCSEDQELLLFKMKAVGGEEWEKGFNARVYFNQQGVWYDRRKASWHSTKGLPVDQPVIEISELMAKVDEKPFWE